MYLFDKNRWKNQLISPLELVYLYQNRPILYAQNQRVGMGI